jgi:hypothetical protein
MTAISATIPAPARRVSPLGGMRNTFTLTWRSVLKIRTNMEDVIGLSLQPIMFLLLFTYVFGGAIAHGSTHDYLQYELPGLLVMTVVFATLGTGLMLNQDITSGVFDRFRSLPIARWAPLAGAVGQPARQHLLRRRQQVPAPVDDRPERPMLGQCRPAAPGQQIEPVVQALRELGRRQRAEPHGGQLDRQRHPVEGPADPGHGGRVGLAELEIRPDRHRPVAQQPDRSV